MSRFLEPILQSFELNQYVQALKSSADRARWAVNVLSVVSLLILLAEWNYLDASWGKQKWNQLETLNEENLRREWEWAQAKTPGAPTGDERRRREAVETPLNDWIRANTDYEQLKQQSDEFVGRMVFVPIPVLNASVHVNDLGIVGGIILFALSSLLSVLMAREHENLYLATFRFASCAAATPITHTEKVRRICSITRLQWPRS